MFWLLILSFSTIGSSKNKRQLHLNTDLSSTSSSPFISHTNDNADKPNSHKKKNTQKESLKSFTSSDESRDSFESTLKSSLTALSALGNSGTPAKPAGILKVTGSGLTKRSPSWGSVQVRPLVDENDPKVKASIEEAIENDRELSLLSDALLALTQEELSTATTLRSVLLAVRARADPVQWAEIASSLTERESRRIAMLKRGHYLPRRLPGVKASLRKAARASSSGSSKSVLPSVLRNPPASESKAKKLPGWAAPAGELPHMKPVLPDIASSIARRGTKGSVSGVGENRDRANKRDTDSDDGDVVDVDDEEPVLQAVETTNWLRSQKKEGARVDLPVSRGRPGSAGTVIDGKFVSRLPLTSRPRVISNPREAIHVREEEGTWRIQGPSEMEDLLSFLVPSPAFIRPLRIVAQPKKKKTDTAVMLALEDEDSGAAFAAAADALFQDKKSLEQARDAARKLAKAGAEWGREVLRAWATYTAHVKAYDEVRWMFFVWRREARATKVRKAKADHLVEVYDTVRMMRAIRGWAKATAEEKEARGRWQEAVEFDTTASKRRALVAWAMVTACPTWGGVSVNWDTVYTVIMAKKAWWALRAYTWRRKQLSLRAYEFYRMPERAVPSFTLPNTQMWPTLAGKVIAKASVADRGRRIALRFFRDHYVRRVLQAWAVVVREREERRELLARGARLSVRKVFEAWLNETIDSAAARTSRAAIGAMKHRRKTRSQAEKDAESGENSVQSMVAEWSAKREVLMSDIEELRKMSGSAHDWIEAEKEAVVVQEEDLMVYVKETSQVAEQGNRLELKRLNSQLEQVYAETAAAFVIRMEAVIDRVDADLTRTIAAKAFSVLARRIHSKKRYTLFIRRRITRWLTLLIRFRRWYQARIRFMALTHMWRAWARWRLWTAIVRRTIPRRLGVSTRIRARAILRGNHVRVLCSRDDELPALFARWVQYTQRARAEKLLVELADRRRGLKLLAPAFAAFKTNVTEKGEAVIDLGTSMDVASQQAARAAAMKSGRRGGVAGARAAGNVKRHVMLLEAEAAIYGAMEMVSSRVIMANTLHDAKRRSTRVRKAKALVWAHDRLDLGATLGRWRAEREAAVERENELLWEHFRGSGEGASDECLATTTVVSMLRHRKAEIHFAASGVEKVVKALYEGVADGGGDGGFRHKAHFALAVGKWLLRVRTHGMVRPDAVALPATRRYRQHIERLRAFVERSQGVV